VVKRTVLVEGEINALHAAHCGGGPELIVDLIVGGAADDAAGVCVGREDVGMRVWDVGGCEGGERHYGG
jgi:hypothetical protein